jgi:hypothetical protein
VLLHIESICGSLLLNFQLQSLPCLSATKQKRWKGHDVYVWEWLGVRPESDTHIICLDPTNDLHLTPRQPGNRCLAVDPGRRRERKFGHWLAVSSTILSLYTFFIWLKWWYSPGIIQKNEDLDCLVL